MAHDQIGNMFVKHYYNIFDTNRNDLAQLYTTQSCLSFEGAQLQGTEQIMAKLTSLPFASVQHIVTTVDVHPTLDNGVMVLVVGQLKTDNDPPHSFSQAFYLKQHPTTGAYVVLNDMFRLSLHHS